MSGEMNACKYIPGRLVRPLANSAAPALARLCCYGDVARWYHSLAQALSISLFREVSLLKKLTSGSSFLHHGIVLLFTLVEVAFYVRHVIF